jgi:ABC-2 type transport system ATP-binding protein
MPPNVAIEARDLGIHFRRNRRGRRTIKDLFGGASRRGQPDSFWPLRNVSFSVEQGEAIGVVGLNGQGKSTLLKLVAGVLKPDEGSVNVHGEVAPLIELTGGFEGNLTVKENISIVSGLHGMRRAEIARRMDDIIDFAELDDFVNTPFKHLSSGMKARLAFSVVSQLEAPTLLVDEVLAVGDRTFRHKCYARIEELLDGGRTLFLVAHSAGNLRRFCSRGLYIDGGTLALDAPIGEVLRRYATDYPTNR